MGKRSRKRATGPLRPAAEAAPAVSRTRSSGRGSRVDRFIDRADERPKAPWHPVPLIELSVLAGIVLIVIGLINRDSSQGRIAGVFGLALAALAGLDTAVRDHFAGFRSHSGLLAAMPTIVVAAVLGLLGVTLGPTVVAAAVVFLAAFFTFRGAFKRRSGVGFKV